MSPQVNKNHYFKRKYDDINRFISYFYQVDLVRNLRNTDNYEFPNILEVGKGSGFFSDYMKKLGYEIKTVDFDKSLEPDYVGDIRRLPIEDSAFDVVTVFEVLEHIPFEEVPKALVELKRVSKKYVIVSVPYKSTGCEWLWKFPGVRTLFKMPFLNFFLRIPLKFGGITISGQHYWEIDMWRYRLPKVRRLLSQFFTIRKEFSPPLNKYHYFFLLEVKKI